MGVRERIQFCQAEPSDTIEISSTSSYSSMESLNMRESNLEEALGKQTKSRRNLKGWLRKSRKAAVPVAQNHLRTTGSRTSRRAARLQGQLACLPELAEDNDNNPKQLDIHSFVNSTRTVFTEIVTNPLLLQEWDEELQNVVEPPQKVENDEMDDSYDWCNDLDANKVQAGALNPERCYRRISKSARARLNMPSNAHLEAIKEVEEDLLDWFTAFPDSVMIKCIESGYNRLLFHSVCRYMNLSSYSVTHGDMRSVNKSEKKTYVQCNWEKFEPPRLLLSNYLSTLVQKAAEDGCAGTKTSRENEHEELIDLDLSGFILVD